MTDQTIRDNHGQIAGGDIHNHAEQSLWDCETNELDGELQRCKKHKRLSLVWGIVYDLAARGLIALGVIAGIALFFLTGLKPGAFDFALFILVASVLLVVLYKTGKQARKYNTQHNVYDSRIELIEFILADRQNR